ncbi:sugar transporter [Ceraceosorus bombacis]|uniref:Sugar transporter n=1 Tax=Ceraceosorus bombacis TaxID=401625 RepID=A0A0P1B7S6_9BASI|nr:sugar transporter [Ceraceosorus bombacis]
MTPKIRSPYAIAAFACIGGILFGFDIASMSAILVTENYKVYFHGDSAVNPSLKPGQEGWLISEGPNATLQGGITAAMPGGSLIGALSAGALADRFGRRAALFIACCFWLVGSILSCAAQNIGMLVVGRFINGICVGIASATVPFYLAELSPSHIRGRVVSAQQWAITWGIMVFYYISLGCSYAADQDGRNTITWRLPWGLQMIPAIFIMGMLPLLPESPRYLAKNARYQDALDVLALVHAKGDASDPKVLAEFELIKENMQMESGEGTSYLDLFRGRQLYRTHLVFFTQVWSQLTGMNVMMYYIGYVFQMAGISDTESNTKSSSIQYAINVVMTVPALIYLDRWGRRPTLLIGAALMGACMLINGIILATCGGPVDRSLPINADLPDTVSWRLPAGGASGRAMIAFTYLFVASYAPTWGPVSWVYPSEVPVQRLRAKSGSISAAGNWMFNFALSYFVPPAFKNLNSYGCYFLFFAFNVMMFIHVFLAFPETKGKSLEEIAAIFESNVPAWRSSKVLKDVHRADDLAQAVARGELTVDAGKAPNAGPQTPESPDFEKKELA